MGDEVQVSFDRRRAAVAIGGFCAFLDLYAPQAVLPQLAEGFKVSPAAAGATIGITTLAVAMSAPFAGMLSDRLGRKVTIVAAALALTVPSLALTLAAGLDQILVWRFLQGLLIPAIFSPLLAFVAEEWPAGEAADVMGLYVAGSALGGFCGRFVTALFSDRFGWRSGFAALTVATLLGAALLWAWLPTRRRPAKATRALSGLAEHLGNPLLLATFAIGFALLFTVTATFTYVNFHLAQEPFNLSTAQLGMVFLVYPLGAFAATGSGWLVRRLGRRLAGALSFLVACAGIALTLVVSLPFIASGLAVYVIGLFLAQSAAVGFVGQTARSAKGAAVGLYVCCYYIGGSAGAVLPGLTVWPAAGWPGCVALMLAVLLAATGMVWWAWRDHK